MPVWGKSRLGAIPESGDRGTPIGEAEFLFLPATMFQPKRKAPAVNDASGGLWYALASLGLQMVCSFGMLAQCGLSVERGGTTARPPLVVVEL